jgi:hypothetical protein
MYQCSLFDALDDIVCSMRLCHHDSSEEAPFRTRHFNDSRLLSFDICALDSEPDTYCRLLSFDICALDSEPDTYGRLLSFDICALDSEPDTYGRLLSFDICALGNVVCWIVPCCDRAGDASLAPRGDASSEPWELSSDESFWYRK